MKNWLKDIFRPSAIGEGNYVTFDGQLTPQSIEILMHDDSQKESHEKKDIYKELKHMESNGHISMDQVAEILMKMSEIRVQQALEIFAQKNEASTLSATPTNI